MGILRDGRLLYQGATKDLIDNHLAPSWLVRIAGDLHPVAAALAGEPWVTRAVPVGADAIRVDATSIEAGERGIPALIAGNGVRITFPPATPAAGVSGYFGELAGTGLIVVVVIAAGAFTFDSHHGLAIFLRTRVTGFWPLIAPRYTVNAGAAGAAFALGALAAWYETYLLIGAPAAGGMLAAVLCGVVYLGYAVAVTAFAATLVRGTLATVGIALAALFALPIAGVYRPIADWLPSALTSAPAALLSGTHHLAHYLPAFGVTVVASGAVLAAAVLRLRAREI